MKIALVIPCSGELPPVISLGTLYLAAALRENAAHQIKIIDARRDGLTERQVGEQIRGFSPQLVGITGLSIEASEVHRLAALVKRIDAGCRVVAGGAYATAYRDSIIKDPHIDFIVIGEGERTICGLAEALEAGKDPSAIAGIGFRKDGKVVITPAVSPIEDIDSILPPAWDLVDMEKYFRPLRKHSQNPVSVFTRVAPVITSRGCSFGCIYCHNIFGKKVRLRRVEDVVDEIETLVKRYALQEIEIIDDIFNYDLPRAKRICDEIIKRGIKVALSFPNALRADMVDEELIVKLKQAGTYVIYYAIESASPQVQRRIDKKLDLPKTKRIIELTVAHGIITGGYFMLGFPQETKEEMLQSIRFALESKLHMASFFYVTCFPHTALSQRLGRDMIDQEEFGHPDYLKLTSNFSSVPDSEFKALIARAYWQFYGRPSQIWRIWKAFPNKMTVFRNLLTLISRLYPK
ncbi:MAG TPA: radical SAM protein [Patescibacteria group bacterium]|nr:radical SAM protein [Patescibacteria group bacterium]